MTDSVWLDAGGALLGLLVGSLITLFTAVCVVEDAWKDKAVAHGCAEYIDDEGVKFVWRDEEGQP